MARSTTSGDWSSVPVDYASQLLEQSASDALDAREARVLFARLEHDAPLREDVVTVLAQFRANLGPFFLRALYDHLQGLTPAEAGEEDAIRYALRLAFALPVAELNGVLFVGEQLRLIEEAA